MHRLIAVIALSALLAACESGTHPVFSPPPAATPPTETTAAILQPSEVPPELSACLGSGPMDVYITTLANSDQALASRIGAQWEEMRVVGAAAGAISLYSANPAACQAELAATPNSKSLTSFVAVFGDAGEADRAWESGIFGFAAPAPAEIPPGIVRGAGTGLGPSSWTYDRPPVRLACWRRSVFVALVLEVGLDLAAFKSATAAVDARLN